MRGAPGTLVFASHLRPHPKVRVCATNIFIGSDIVAATIFRFVNGRCHQYTSSTCVRNLISHDAFENLGPRRVPHSRGVGCESLQTLQLSMPDKVVGKNRYLSWLQRSFGLFFLCFHCLNNITALCYHCHVLGHNN